MPLMLARLPSAGPLLAALAALSIAAAPVVIKGISYGVSPAELELPRNDDFMCNEAAPMWNHSGRGDLVVIKALGANTVRLYGNDPREDHTDFLDTAYGLGLKVIPGNSDWPFLQAPDSCQKTTNYSCMEQVKAAYMENLKKGFLTQTGRYDPSLSHIVAINEPDMKLPNIESPRDFCKAIISGIDGMLEAEREAHASPAFGSSLPNITATFSWSVCQKCDKYTGSPGLGQMWQLRDAMLNPNKYGYSAKNNLTDAYRTRFVHSFNTANPSFQIRPLFLDDYEKEFPDTPLFIAEYHWNNRKSDQQQDIEDVLEIVSKSPLLLGISYFEFWKRTDEGGHLDFGIFEPGVEELVAMSFFGGQYSVRCMMAVEGWQGRSLPAQVAAAYGGKADKFRLNRCLTGGERSAGAYFVGDNFTTTQARTTATPMASTVTSTVVDTGNSAGKLRTSNTTSTSRTVTDAATASVSTTTTGGGCAAALGLMTALLAAALLESGL